MKSYQDGILNQMRKENMRSTIFLTNGFQIRGVVKGFDAYVVLFETDGQIQMIYKHAISTVAPGKSVAGVLEAYSKKIEIESESGNDSL